MKDKVLVTGADGFIGSHLVDNLVRQGYSVRAFVQYNSQNRWGWMEDVSREILDSVEIFSADLRDSFSVRRAISGCKIVCHLGALIAIPYSYTAPQEYISTNVMGTLNVLEAALSEKVDHLIHTSTSETYGTAHYVPIDEKHPLQGQSPYSASKIGADKLAESYHLSFGLPVTTIRPFNTYGPRQSARAIIPTIIGQALSQPEIRLGSLEPVRDLNFVEDTVDGFIRALRCQPSLGEVINLGFGKGVSMGELAKTILELMKIEKKMVTDEQRIRPAKSEVLQLVCDNRKAATLLGWTPKTSLKEGLARTIEWFKGHSSFYKSSIYNL